MLILLFLIDRRDDGSFNKVSIAQSISGNKKRKKDEIRVNFLSFYEKKQKKTAALEVMSNLCEM